MEAAATELGGPPDIITGMDRQFAAVVSTSYTFRDCYLECSARGYTPMECGQACGGLLHPEDELGAPTPRGPCYGFWDCFGKGFAVPQSVITGGQDVLAAGKWVVVGLVALVALNVLRIVR